MKLTVTTFLSLHGVMQGPGGPRFPDGTTPAALRLIDTKTTNAGVVIHVYEPAGKPTYRSIPIRVGARSR